MAQSTNPAAAAAITVLLALAACGGDDDEGTGGTSATAAPTTTSTSTPAPPADLPGRLMFSRFMESNHTFVSTHITNADGSDEHDLRLPGPEGGGRWSHDGAHIAVMTLTDDDRVGTAIITPDGTVERVLALPDPTINLVCAVWSRDDARLACEGWDDGDESRRGIYAVDAADGGNLKRLTTAEPGMVDLPGDFSPDGTQLVFKRSADEADGPMMLVDVAGGEPHAIGDGEYEDPGRLSPDGTHILTAAGGSLFVLDLDGAVVTELDETGVFRFGAVWSPDGDWIAYSAATSGPYADVFISRPDGSDAAQVTDTSDNEIVVEWGAEPQ